jgi:hypothetical protein
MNETGSVGDLLDAVVDDLDLRPVDLPRSTSMRRRMRGRPEALPTLRLVRRDGVLFVEEGGGRGGIHDRRRSARDVLAGGTVEAEQVLARLDKNQVGGAIEKIDRRLNRYLDPARLARAVLRRHDPDRGLVPFTDGARLAGRTLLFVHGTFSHGDGVLSEIDEIEDETGFLRWAHGEYEHVLTFEHPTLAVSPMINARELSVRLRDSSVPIDVICHSRGGLVARWWLEAFDRADPSLRRAVFVGSPLCGTGLAAPPNIRSSLSLLSNVADVLGKVSGKASAAFPFMTVVAGIFQILSSVTKLAAKTPAVDAAISMVPGLVAMSRVGNNQELHALRAERVGLDRYFVVQSNFEPDDVRWKFWRHFRPLNVAGRAADVVFEGTNDLVVDTGSMNDFFDGRGGVPRANIHDFETSATVHHTNYFRQPQTLQFIRSRLSL